MKHPYQIIAVDRTGKHLFASVKNHLQVFDLSNGKLIGSWEDTVDIFTPNKTQQDELLKKRKVAEELKAKEVKAAEEKLKEQSKTVTEEAENVEEPSKKKQKIYQTGPKFSIPGPGAPPIYNYIRALVLSRDEKFLVGTTDSDKAAVIFEIDFSKSNCLRLIKRQIFPKRPCSISIDEDLNIIVADKFGDVYTIKIDEEAAVDEKDLVPILGHVSMLSDVLIAKHEGRKFILSGDRDEHIRVTNFPKAYVIKNWLFGHHEFISTMLIPEFDSSLLISGGGDDYLCIWKWVSNELVGKLELRPHLEEFLNDQHLPPARFLNENSTKEISINTILTVSINKKNLLIVGSENTNALLVFEIKGNNFEHLQTFRTTKPLVSLCAANDRIIASVDDETNSELVEFYKFNGDNVLELEKSEITNTITKQNGCEVGSRSEFYPLYYINTLRKRSDH